jgi:WD40 repeat protein
MGNAQQSNNGVSRGCCGFGTEDHKKPNIKDSESLSIRSPVQVSLINSMKESQSSSLSFRSDFNVATDRPSALNKNSDLSQDVMSQSSSSSSSSSGSDSDESDFDNGDKSINNTNESTFRKKGKNSIIKDEDGDTNMMNTEDVTKALTCNEAEQGSGSFFTTPTIISIGENLPTVSKPAESLFKPQYKRLLGYENWVEAVATHGTKLVTAGVDEEIKIWNCSQDTTSIYMTMSGHDDVVTSVMFSNDGKHVVSGSVDKTVRIWEVKRGKLESSMYGHTSAITAVAYSKDDVYVVSGSIDNTMRLWNVFDGVYQCVKVFRGHTNAVDSVEYSPDGKSIISGSEDATLRVWDPTSGECTNVIRGYTGWFYCVAHAPQRFNKPDYVCTGSHIGNVIDIWNVNTSQLHKTMRGHTGPVLSVAYSPDGQYIASGSVDHTVRVWHVETGTCVAVLEGHANIAGCVAFGSDGTNTIIVSGSRDHEVRLWYVNEIAPSYFNHTLGSPVHKVYSVGEL